MAHTANGAQPAAAQEPSVGELVKHLSPVPAQAVESVRADVNEVKERAHR